VCFLEGLVFFKNKWLLYYGTADSKIAVAEASLYDYRGLLDPRAVAAKEESKQRKIAFASEGDDGEVFQRPVRGAAVKTRAVPHPVPVEESAQPEGAEKGDILQETQGNEEQQQGNEEETQGNEEQQQGNEEETQGNEEETQGNEEETQGQEEETQGNEEEQEQQQASSEGVEGTEAEAVLSSAASADEEL
jgi:hypothetical protein